MDDDCDDAGEETEGERKTIPARVTTQHCLGGAPSHKHHCDGEGKEGDQTYHASFRSGVDVVVMRVASESGQQTTEYCGYASE